MSSIPANTCSSACRAYRTKNAAHIPNKVPPEGNTFSLLFRKMKLPRLIFAHHARNRIPRVHQSRAAVQSSCLLAPVYGIRLYASEPHVVCRRVPVFVQSHDAHKRLPPVFARELPGRRLCIFAGRMEPVVIVSPDQLTVFLVSTDLLPDRIFFLFCQQA